MPACNATYKNGISFHGWSERPGHGGYFHPFPASIDVHTAPGFYYNSHFRRQGFDLEADPDRFFLSAQLARRRLAPIPARNFPFEMAYGYHFDAYLVGAFLRDLAVSRGVAHMEAKVRDVRLTEAGDIAALVLEDREAPFKADFFVDATGFRSLLLQEAMGVPFKSFADNLFNDAAVVLPTPVDPSGIHSQTRATALSNGWVWNIPLTNRSGNGYVYSTRYCAPEAAERELRAHLGLGADVEARHLKMKVGQVERHWRRNCLAVGLAQGFIEPLEATALHLVQATVEQFISAFEAGGYSSRHEAAFNSDIAARFEGVRDYIVCHYKANLRRDTPYWRDNAANDRVSDTLARVLAAWSGGADMKQTAAELGLARYYPLTSWICLLGGYGNYPPEETLGAAPAEHRRFDLATIDDFIERCALNFRDHRTVLAELAA